MQDGPVVTVATCTPSLGLTTDACSGTRICCRSADAPGRSRPPELVITWLGRYSMFYTCYTVVYKLESFSNRLQIELDRFKSIFVYTFTKSK